MEADHRFARVAQDPRFKASLEISCVVWLPIIHRLFLCYSLNAHLYRFHICDGNCLPFVRLRSIVELAFSLKSDNVCYMDLSLFTENLAKREEA